MKENSKYCTGDYYPLTPWTMAPDRWMAWQLHRADLDEGMILAFRHKESPYSALQVNPRGLKSGQTYQVTFIGGPSFGDKNDDGAATGRFGTYTFPPANKVSWCATPRRASRAQIKVIQWIRGRPPVCIGSATSRSPGGASRAAFPFCFPR